MTPTTPVERITDLEARMKIQEKKTDELSDIAAELKEYVAQAKGSATATKEMHRENRWWLATIIALLTLLTAYETLKKEHPQPQKTTQVQPGPAHSDMPAEFTGSTTSY